jgi:ubiquinone/menaquinone biosynthesis C-methylase UbiE
MNNRIQYLALASVLKVFSATPATRRMYRTLGNLLGARSRASGKMPGYYRERVERMIDLSVTQPVPRDGCRVIELGTGWMHWEALTMRLFYDIEAILFDVWDNRQLPALKNYLRQLIPAIQSFSAISDGRRSRAITLAREVLKLKRFEEIYELLGMTYVVQSDGSLRQFQSLSFDLVTSAGVLEHVNCAAAPVLAREIARILRLEGYSFHSINIRDHLYLYTRNVNPKEYLRFSDETWSRWYDNEVQYINRLQRSEWLSIFETAGLTLIREEVEKVSIAEVPVSSRFSSFDETSLCCGGLVILHQKK